ncbi:hypothetical protein KL918_003957 [Ogataea parapolymorpha]|uniref:CUE domain-containing protein n=1 Tax=Ogataea parapolymorpha (strain ATCC 26012 / BCRC 20466 / JCM 22074 / NRRL Y-7560 / DL-1) TaxID=871575 RepID=W1QCP0_OGAPD|nr:hypothetical protein HPODL_03929 [Ogataea parapolymorpha DL-1]ESW98299.1 hypothetical protein HPODL_03929 [Ogataea parapolymorpha DL-1]KAG7865968.1 hypothetical protein KL918_003957 [Ogataea parapolymorpha]KAG7874878.1 hypothetical protein KL916_001122 [Ogataea parapolymorpha]
MDHLDIPIVAYPPFKLRSSLIDKDPVIWQHLLESYIDLFEKLIVISTKKGVKLSLKSQQQLTAFMKVYLSETSEESTKIFSLGAINPEIVRNQKRLKIVVFQFIKIYNLVNLKLAGESVWDFCKVYLRLAYENMNVNQSLISVGIVRDLVEGRVRSKITSKSDDVSLVKSLQDYLRLRISDTKFNRIDLETLSMLLGQKIKNRGSSKQRVVVGRGQQDGFSERFVNAHWIDILERLYNRGDSLHAQQCFEIALVSFVSLTSAKIINLVKDLGVVSRAQLIRNYPLVARIILSSKFQDMNPDLRTKLFESKSPFDQHKIQSLLDVFPQLTEAQCKTLLKKYKTVEEAMNKVLEGEEVEEYTEKKKARVQFGKKDFSLKADSKTQRQLKKKTLENALRMLYESAEDEPDDTYDDQDLTTGAGSLAKDEDYESDEEFAESKHANHEKDQTMESLDLKLLQIFKSNPEAFDRSSRYTNYRNQLKNELKWTDEQIEGWARMLERNPRRFKLLEEKLLDVGGSLNGSLSRTKFQQDKHQENEGSGSKPKKSFRGGRSNRKLGHDRKMAKQFN